MPMTAAKALEVMTISLERVSPRFSRSLSVVWSSSRVFSTILLLTPFITRRKR